MHRWTHWKNTGEIPEEVMHLCDNPKCINPKHLQSGNRQLNVADRSKKHRSRSMKLSDQDVREIRVLISQGISKSIIATQYDINASQIYRIADNVIYKYVI